MDSRGRQSKTERSLGYSKLINLVCTNSHMAKIVVSDKDEIKSITARSVITLYHFIHFQIYKIKIEKVLQRAAVYYQLILRCVTLQRSKMDSSGLFGTLSTTQTRIKKYLIFFSVLIFLLTMSCQPDTQLVKCGQSRGQMTLLTFTLLPVELNKKIVKNLPRNLLICDWLHWATLIINA